MTQHVLLVIPGTGNESIGHRVEIESDTTVADLLRAAQLDPEHFMLQKEQGGQHVSLSSQDRVADHVQEGEKVFAFASDILVA